MRLTLAFIATLAFLAAFAAGEAHGGIYQVAQCHPGENRTHSFTVGSNTPDYAAFAECAPGGRGMGIHRRSGAEHTEGGRFTGWYLTVPADTAIRRVIASVHSRQESSHVPRLGALLDSAPAAYLYPSDNDPYQQETLSTGVSGRTFFLQLYCNRPASGTCAPPAGTPHLYAHSIVFEMQDSSPPGVPSVQGPVVAGGVRSGTQGLSGTVSDLGSGVERVLVFVNGALAAQSPQSCLRSSSGQMAATFVPCPWGQRPYGFNLDTERSPWRNGVNTLQVCARDFSGAQACAPLRTVHIDNSCPSSAAVGGDALGAEIRGRRRVTVRSDERLRLGGRLRQSGGATVTGATICLYEQVMADGEAYRRVGTTTTGGDGSYSFALRPGPSRHLTAVYRHDSTVRSAHVEVTSWVVPAFRARPGTVRRNGCVRLLGRIPGPRASDRVVNFQARLAEGGRGRWVNFHNGRTTESGAFRPRRYCFRATTSATTYRFRVLVKQQSGYPYLRGASRPVRVRVR